MPAKENDQTQESQPRSLLFNWHFVAKIALVIAAISCLAAVLVLNYITGSIGQNYVEMARYFSSSRASVGPTLLVAGLILVSFVSVITWLMALYTSFYIAGPLFRFSRNLEVLIKQGPIPLMPTRSTDLLKEEERVIKRSVARLQQHYSEMRATAEEMLGQLDSQPSTLNALIAKLKKGDHEVHL